MNTPTWLPSLKSHRDLYIAIFIGLFSYALFFWNPTPIRSIESMILDWHYAVRGNLTIADSPIAIVTIDNQSLKQEGRWPWSRQKIAQLGTKILESYHAKTLAFDMVFSEPAHNQSKRMIDWMQENHISIPKILEHYQQQHNEDAILATLMANEKRIVQGLFYTPGKQQHSDDLALMKQLDACLFTSINATSNTTATFNSASELTINIPELMPPLGGCGFMNFIPDADGAIRTAPIMVNYQNFYIPSLALSALKNWSDSHHLNANITPGLIDISMDKHLWKAASNGSITPVFQGEMGTIPTYSAVDVLHGKIATDALKGKLVFLGLSAAGIDDIRPTPVDSAMPGTEVQAQIAYALLTHQLLNRPDALVLAEFLLILIIIIGYGLFFKRVIEHSHGLTTLLLVAITAAISHFLFLQGIWVHLVVIYLQVFITFSTLFIIHYAVSLQHRLHLRHVFSTYIDPSVVDEALANDSGDVLLGGQDREISVMFMDVAGFTALSEKLSPQEIVQCINQFFDAATPIVQKYDGCIDRLMGDGLIALFGTPLLRQEHAANACRVTLEMETALNVIRPVFEKHGHQLSVRIGINTGTMTVGNMGSSQRVHYTFMGDAGNVAARLESLNKQYGSLHMIGESTWQQVKEKFVCREMDTVILVGKSEPMRIFELRDSIEKLKNHQLLLDGYAEALKFYRQGSFQKAAAAFARVYTKCHDQVAKNMQLRCEQLLRNPPDDWQGIWKLQQK